MDGGMSGGMMGAWGAPLRLDCSGGVMPAAHWPSAGARPLSLQSITAAGGGARNVREGKRRSSSCSSAERNNRPGAATVTLGGGGESNSQPLTFDSSGSDRVPVQYRYYPLLNFSII